MTAREMLKIEGKHPLGTSKVERSRRAILAKIGYAAGAITDDLFGSKHKYLWPDKADVANTSFIGTGVLNGTQGPIIRLLPENALQRRTTAVVIKMLATYWANHTEMNAV